MNKQDMLDKYTRKRNSNNPYIEPVGGYWDTAKTLSMLEFSKEINLLPYKSDPLWGLIDYTSDMNKFFDTGRTHSRDCDCFARAWCVWAKSNGYSFQEYIVTTEHNIILDSHVVAVIHVAGAYYLCNYESYGPYTTEYDALDSIRNWERYKDGFIFSRGVFG